MQHPAADLARRLASEAEAVCRHYLSNGRRAGRYWLVGDVANTPGRSLFVRLHGSDCGVGAAGKWTDAATGQHGDLLDLIALNRGLTRFADVLDEARAFLRLPDREREYDHARARRFRLFPSAIVHSIDRRLRTPHAVCSPCRSRSRARWPKPIFATAPSPSCPGPRACDFIRAATIGATRRRATEIWPAMIAGVTDLSGDLTGVQRTWLDPSGRGKATSQRRDGPWAISSDTAFASAIRPGTPATRWRPARASKPCSRSVAS